MNSRDNYCSLIMCYQLTRELFLAAQILTSSARATSYTSAFDSSHTRSRQKEVEIVYFISTCLRTTPPEKIKIDLSEAKNPVWWTVDARGRRQIVFLSYRPQLAPLGNFTRKPVFTKTFSLDFFVSISLSNKSDLSVNKPTIVDGLLIELNQSLGF